MLDNKQSVQGSPETPPSPSAAGAPSPSQQVEPCFWNNVALTFAYDDVLSITEYVSGSWANLTAHAQDVNVVTN